MPLQEKKQQLIIKGLNFCPAGEEPAGIQEGKISRLITIWMISAQLYIMFLQGKRILFFPVTPRPESHFLSTSMIIFTHFIQPLKNNVFGILLFVCLITPVVTTFIFLQYQKKQIKREVKWRIIAGIDREELVLLKFTEKEKQTRLNWKHAREFEYSGEMYDIVETELKGDTIYYWCWWDHEETKLNKQLEELVSFACGNNAGTKENQKQLFKFFKSLCFSKLSREVTFDIALHHVPNFTCREFECMISDSPPAPPPEKPVSNIDL